MKAFPPDARAEAGHELFLVQQGELPEAMTNHITPADGNVYEDLGLPPQEARNLKIRSMLMLTAKRFIEERGLTQLEAADLMGVSQPRISELVRGRIGQFTIDSLILMLTRAGVTVEVRAAGNVA